MGRPPYAQVLTGAALSSMGQAVLFDENGDATITDGNFTVAVRLRPPGF